MKIIKVTHCSECPYENHVEGLCDEAGKENHECIEIPDWCPLEDLK